jgi:hypothetical protein
VHRLSDSEAKKLTEDVGRRYWLEFFVKEILEGEKTISPLSVISSRLFSLQSVLDGKPWIKRN